MSGKVREQAFLLGARQSLVGIVTDAADAGARADRPTIVILNAGIIHRVGPGRMSVLLARALAAAGNTVLRFDLSGLGDSPPRPDGLAPLEAGLADIREAIDWLETARGTHRVVLLGLCSGANYSLLYARSDRRVVGAVLLDPSTPKTLRYYLRHYVPRLFRLSVWHNVVRGRHAWVRRLAGHRDETREAWGPDLQSPQVRSILEDAYRGALEQGVRFLMAFTSGLEEQHNYREQVLDAFPRVPFGDRVHLEYFDGVQHTFPREADRARLFRMVVDWVDDTAFSP